ncbi:hypothetical protein EDD22DRAFT_196961 [Suillus occidentalis]|nr:hypothetical protein EDD22DRAFT_196961 [Suillus occidentalis]
MAPFLETVKSFKDVPITDDGVNTVAFLEADDGVVRILKELTGLMSSVGSKAFSPVISDIQGNITKVRERYNAAPSESATLEQLVTNEKNNKVGKRNRGPHVAASLPGSSQANPSSKHRATHQRISRSPSRRDMMSPSGLSIRGAGFFSIQGAIMKAAGLMFNTAIGYCPPRKGFYEKLAANPNGEPCSQELLDKQLNDWIAGLDTIITRMDKFYTKGKAWRDFQVCLKLYISISAITRALCIVRINHQWCASLDSFVPQVYGLEAWKYHQSSRSLSGNVPCSVH